MSEFKSVAVVPLSSKNYSTWKLQCKMALMKDNLWGIVTGTETAPAGVEAAAKFSLRRDRALATIILALDASILYLVGDPTEPKEVWDKLEQQFQKKSWVNKYELRKKLYNLRLNEGDSMENHIKQMTEIFNSLAVIGEVIKEEDRVVHLLASLPDSYDMLVTAFQTNSTVPAMELVIERLVHEEQKIKTKNYEPSTSRDENVLFTKKTIKCYHCGRRGHIKRNCREYRQEFRNNKIKHQNYNSAEISSNFSNDEECAGLVANQVNCNVKCIGNSSDWIIDSGATCHMCNNLKLFSDMRELSSVQKVALGNDSMVEATARGTVYLNMKLPGNIIKKYR